MARKSTRNDRLISVANGKEELPWEQSKKNSQNRRPEIRKKDNWSSAELQELWELRYEQKPKAIYDDLAKRFQCDTEDIVNTLILMQSRRKCGQDPYQAI